MAKKSRALAPKGGDSAVEMLLLVGESISWWERSEDTMLGLFRAICGETEPVAMEAFIHAPRKVRNSMLKLALQTYKFRFDGGEIDEIQSSLKQMDKLAIVRNEIAHGLLVENHEEVDGSVVAEGNYWLPSLNENGPMEREYRFHHTPETLREFIKCVSVEKLRIQSVYIAVMERGQALTHQPELDGWGQFLIQTARKIGRLELTGLEAINQIRKIVQSMNENSSKPHSGI